MDHFNDGDINIKKEEGIDEELDELNKEDEDELDIFENYQNCPHFKKKID